MSKTTTINISGLTYSLTISPPNLLEDSSKMNEEDILDMLCKVPITTLQEIRDIYLEKNKCVKEMQFQKAAELRDKEKMIYEKNGLPTNLRVHEMKDLLETIRERQINNILNENR
jgi:hypothetical protein